MTHFDDLGPNSGLVEDLYQRYLENPSSVDEHWRAFFSGEAPPPNGEQAEPPRAPAAAPPPPPPAPAPAVASTLPVAPASRPGPMVLDGDEPEPLRGAAARTVENMEASLSVPTATSVRAMPAKLLEVNRQILNNQLARTGAGKVSFTHLIAFAVLRALHDFPALNSSYAEEDGKPVVVRHQHVNLGLAVDVQRRDGTHSLLVPNVKDADTLDFATFWEAYEAAITKVRGGTVSPDDFAGTTCTITNPGMIGTVHSVPRLLPGQGFILGVGAIGYPAEYEGADPATLAQLGVSKVTTLTNTYDHRIITGAESGEFLRRIHDLLLGGDEFYDDVFASLAVPYEPARWNPDRSALADPVTQNEKVVQVHSLINMYRVRGHLIANLDPLGRRPPHTHPELDVTHYGLSIWDLDREFPVGNLGAGHLPHKVMPLREILSVLRDAYSRTVGVEYMHIQEPDQKEWIQERVEGTQLPITHDERQRILERLNAAEAFERFLHAKYLGQKRFSLEGAETLVPMLDALCSDAADTGMTDVVLGMTHRGRLNALANVVGKSYEQIFREFEGELDPASAQGSGDVKYHLGATGKHQSPSGAEVALTLAANPSHLEAVDPVVEGMARAIGDARSDRGRNLVLPALVHGDAAFAGQGVVAETLNLSEVPGYEVGGTVHIVVNNQLGFTTAPDLGRSSVYATDIAKMVQAPIFHVNGDDPEAAVRVIHLAFAFRRAFYKDVVVDLVCYRRYGHNEADEPAFTQPRMYGLIDTHESVRAIYTKQLLQRGDITPDDEQRLEADFRARLDAAFAETHAATTASRDDQLDASVATLDLDADTGESDAGATGVSLDVLDLVVDGLTRVPEGFSVNPKLGRQLLARRTAFDHDEIDWALAEALAFGSLVLQGTPVRLAGQDTRRGTFSQRHSVLVDQVDEAEYEPLNHLSDDQARFMVYDTVLSEYAALGFEYGYSVVSDALVCWEAQFGDFANVSQVVIDQFVVAAADKWGQHSSLGLLLPHGFEGQGPEHSSARIERYLTLCAEHNMRVVYPSTAAQYFHALRRQAVAVEQIPLVCFTPKRYLRMPHTRSSRDDLATGRFETVLDDRAELDRESVTRVLVCTGKIAHELMDERDAQQAPVAVVRLEQLYPWPGTRLVEVLDRYPNAREVWWVQEEPANMGAWTFVHERVHALLRDRAELRHLARPASASPASGSTKIHEREQRELLAEAFA
ncbi:MAG TPA: multifunctional oxoglutarate decarboxylase/oxoglutarate dehydrogenase thiamine pyrophosphate-binding subunit/dihydrolipoyllysine-residue succinyltransferase subunit [Acidimicrobiia bacterium]|nr:multifunctional oxoglutarate decarboxylase/oxoglutarate dehydrogenase thiamine pyrophosphate-binding subunit/dihydrolipoyllysine-residue succinyltransferase subunit [Acidimicrobiia bacterium]